MTTTLSPAIKSRLFSQAHAWAREIRQPGDNYQVVWGQCYRLLVAQYRAELARPLAGHLSARIADAGELVAAWLGIALVMVAGILGFLHDGQVWTAALSAAAASVLACLGYLILAAVAHVVGDIAESLAS